jgi:DNA sulfur modification protein DndD
LFDAVKALYGTGILDHLSESLRSYISNEKSRLQKDVGSVRLDELEQKRLELDNHKDQLKIIQASLMASRKEKVDAEERRQQVEGNLYSMVGDKASDIEEYSSTIAALQEEELKLKQQMISEVGSLALPLALNRSARQLISTLQMEQVRAKWLLLKDEAAGKAASIVENVLPENRPADVSPPLLDTQAAQLRAALEKALEALWSPPPDGCAPSFRFKFLHDNDRPMVVSKIQKGVNGGFGSLADTALELHGVTTKLEETRLRFERTRDIQPALQKLKSDLQSVLESHREISSAVSGFEHQERGLQQTISDLRGAIGQMENRQEAGSPIQEKLDAAQRLRSLVDDASEQLVPLCRDALEAGCTKHFAAMISGEYAKFKARFETDSEPWLESPNGQQVLVSSLSGAQKRVFGLAFTLAVADVSQTEAPIVIDTPVGNMDSEYRARVLKYVASVAPGQVIFLSHNEEIYGQYVDAIAPRIRKRFLVSFSALEDGAGVSTVADNEYFEI